MSTETEKESEEVESPDVHFQPLVTLPLVETNTLEDNEYELLKLRAKLFRFDSTADPPEWKERGVGEVKLMKSKTQENVRLIMRRDKTHKICANHLLTKEMKLLASAGSDRAWVWSVLADFADEEAKKEQLAIRFRNAEIAQKFKVEFERCQALLSSSETNDLVTNIEQLTVNDKDDEVGSDEKNTTTQENDLIGNAVSDPPQPTETDEGSPPGSETVLQATDSSPEKGTA